MLERYTAIASVNPAFEEGRGESDLAEALAEDLRDLGAQVVFQPVTGDRVNVLGYVEVDPTLPTVTFDAHLDTVPMSGRATARPSWEGDRLFARGACDDKGALVAMVEAVRCVVTDSHPPKANMRILGSVDEEVGCAGSEAAHDLVADSDLIVVGEPTQLDVGVWHKGTTRFELETIGVSSHSSVPHLGTNAIEIMVVALRRVIEEVKPELRAVEHPSGEQATLNIGVITGGGALNQVPDRCLVGIDLRRLPGQNSTEILDRFDSAIRDLLTEGTVVRHRPFLDAPSFETSCSWQMVDAIVTLCRIRQPSAKAVGLPYGTNASRLAQSGTPTIIIGPGSITHAHTDDEHVALSEVASAAELFIDIADNLGHVHANSDDRPHLDTERWPATSVGYASHMGEEARDGDATTD